MKRSRLRRQGVKHQKRARESKPIRDALIAEAGACMICGASEKKPRHRVKELNQLCCHEIANGPCRQMALDKPYAILVLCWYCNGSEVTDKAQWPEARQLAVLMYCSPHHYDLAGYNQLVNPRAPRRIEQHEVDAFRD